MQITTVVELSKRKHLPPLQRRALAFLEEHADEVFTYRDDKLVAELASKPSAVGFTLWALEKAGLIEKEAVAGRVYFGSILAIGHLRRQLGSHKGDPFARAFANADRIRERIGRNLDSLDILDELRGSNELP